MDPEVFKLHDSVKKVCKEASDKNREHIYPMHFVPDVLDETDHRAM